MPRYHSSIPQSKDSGQIIVPFVAVLGLVVLLTIVKSKANSHDSTSTTNNRSRTSTTPKLAASTPEPPAQPSQPAFVAAPHHRDGKYHLLLCATGSVATIKIPNICTALAQYANLSVRVVLTESATQFLQGQSAEQPRWDTLKQIRNVDGVYVDQHEWRRPWKRGDNILHIELRRWADLMVIAPLSANGLAKLATGMSDNLLMSVARAWDTDGLVDGVRPGIILEGGERRKTIMVAPAMNTAMWRHPVTVTHLSVLKDHWGVQGGGWIELLAPIEKGLACGDVGSGGMKDWKTIVGDIERKFPNLRKVTESR